MRFVTAAASVLAALSLGALAFVWVDAWQLGWLDEDDARIVPLRKISQEALPLAYRAGMMNAWVHDIRVGQVVDFHEHPDRGELAVILRGRARVRGLRRDPQGGEPLLREEILGPGGLVFSPPAAVHELANIGSEPLWTLVFMSPPVKENVYLDGAAPRSTRDLTVIADSGGPPGSRALDFYPGIPGLLLRGPRELRGSGAGSEAWIVLIRGSGRLEVAGMRREVRAPTWISAPGGRWSLEPDPGELVALEFSLPRFDARLFLRSVLERSGFVDR